MHFAARLHYISLQTHTQHQNHDCQKITDSQNGKEGGFYFKMDFALLFYPGLHGLQPNGRCSEHTESCSGPSMHLHSIQAHLGVKPVCGQ